MVDSLTVVKSFASYMSGDVITDPATMLSIITNSALAKNVVTTTPGGEAGILYDVQGAIAAGLVVAGGTLVSLTLSTYAATAGAAFSATIIGGTAGSTITATSSNGTVLTVSGSTVSGTFSAAGSPVITLVETLAGATGSPKTSTITLTVAAAGAAPANTVLPTISGTAQVGQTLTASNGTWTGSPTSYLYQWYRAGVAISGATSSTYTPVTGDIGSALTIGVTAVNGTGTSTAVSSATASVTAASAGSGGTADFSQASNSNLITAIAA